MKPVRPEKAAPKRKQMTRYRPSCWNLRATPTVGPHHLGGCEEDQDRQRDDDHDDGPELAARQEGLGPFLDRRRDLLQGGGGVGRQQELAQPGPDRRRPGLEGQPGAEHLGQRAGLGGLATAVDALERNEATPGRHLRTVRSAQPSWCRRPSSSPRSSWRPPSSPPSSWPRPSWPSPSSWPARPSWPPSSSRRGAGGPALAQQLGRALHVDRLHHVALAQAGVGGAVGHVGAEAAVLDDDGQVGGRVGAQLAQRRGRGPAPALLGLREQRLRLGEGHGQQLLLAAEAARVGAALEVGAEAPVVGHHVLVRLGVRPDDARDQQQLQRLLQRQRGRLHGGEERRRARLVAALRRPRPPGRRARSARP